MQINLDQTKMKLMYKKMIEKVEPLKETKDAWVKKMIKWHFSEETGSPFWLAQKKKLNFDPLKEINCYDDMKKFGLFDKTLLNTVPAVDLVPRGFNNKTRSIRETGGTTGEPLKIVDVTTGIYNVELYSIMLEARGLHGCNVIGMTPSGPHAYGNFVKQLVDSWNGTAFFIDFDPRWIKKLIIKNESTDDYIDHLVSQTEVLLNTQNAKLLFTTSKLVQELAVRLSKPLYDYGIRGICTGGTSSSNEEMRYLQEGFVKDVQWIDTYGNTLMGHALQGDPWEENPARSYYIPPPLAFIEVVDPENWQKLVDIGKRGRVKIITLLEDLFIPNLLERDSAIRLGPHPWYPWDGVADVKPFTADKSERIVEGVY